MEEATKAITLDELKPSLSSLSIQDMTVLDEFPGNVSGIGKVLRKAYGLPLEELKAEWYRTLYTRLVTTWLKGE